MNILGIETSCDETAASIVKDGRWILSNIVSSSLKQHQKYGGIIPEIASRRQLEYINGVVEEAFKEANLKPSDIAAVAVTQSPGLIGSLLVGISFARALSWATSKPLIEVDHIHAHVYANFLKEGNTPHREIPKLPAIGLVVSGGHSSLFHIKNFDDFKLLGQTRDDAAGEAFDKVAKILNLGYPGGPIIDRLAREGENKEIQFTCANIPNSHDFSFSGIKTAVLYYTRKHQNNPEFSAKKVAYSFQQSVTSALVNKSIDACRRKKIKTLLVGGGVAANSGLRKQLTQGSQEEMIEVFFPPLPLCLDNAAMIAGLAYHLYQKKGAQR